MSYPHVVMSGIWTIRIDFPRLFQDVTSSCYQEFLTRGFDLEEVVSVEVDRSIGSAFVHLHPLIEKKIGFPSPIRILFGRNLLTGIYTPALRKVFRVYGGVCTAD